MGTAPSSPGMLSRDEAPGGLRGAGPGRSPGAEVTGRAGQSSASRVTALTDTAVQAGPEADATALTLASRGPGAQLGEDRDENGASPPTHAGSEVAMLREENARLQRLVGSLMSKLEEQAELSAAQLRASTAVSGSSSAYNSAVGHLIKTAGGNFNNSLQTAKEWLAFKTVLESGCRTLVTLDPLLLRDNQGGTLLHGACKVALYGTVRAFLDAKLLPVDVRDWAGRTPLMMAASSVGSKAQRDEVKRIVTALVDGFADVDAVDLFGRNALQHFAMSSALMGKGAKRRADEAKGDEEEFRFFITEAIKRGRARRVQQFKSEALALAMANAANTAGAIASSPSSGGSAGAGAGAGGNTALATAPSTPLRTTSRAQQIPLQALQTQPAQATQVQQLQLATFKPASAAMMIMSRRNNHNPSMSMGGQLGGSPLTPSLAVRRMLVSAPALPASSTAAAAAASEPLALFSPPPSGTPSSGTPSSARTVVATHTHLSPAGPFSPALVLQPSASPSTVAVGRSPMADARLQNLPSRSSIRAPPAVDGLEPPQPLLPTISGSGSASGSASTTAEETIRAWAYYAVLRIDALSPIRWPAASPAVMAGSASGKASIPFFASPDEMPSSAPRAPETSINDRFARLAIGDGSPSDGPTPIGNDGSLPKQRATMRVAPHVVVRKVAVPESLLPSAKGNIQLRAVELSEDLTSGCISVCSVGPWYVGSNEDGARKRATKFAELWNLRIKRDAGAAMGSSVPSCAAECCKAEASKGDATPSSREPVPCPLHGGPRAPLEAGFFCQRRHKCRLQGFPEPLLPSTSTESVEPPRSVAAGTEQDAGYDTDCIDCWLRNHCPQAEAIPGPLLAKLLDGTASSSMPSSAPSGAASTLPNNALLLEQCGRLYCEFSAAAAGRSLCDALAILQGDPMDAAAATTTGKPLSTKSRNALMLPPLTPTVEAGAGGDSATAAAVPPTERSASALAQARRHKASARPLALVRALLASSSPLLPAFYFPAGMFAPLPKSTWLARYKRNDRAGSVPADSLTMAGRMQGEGKDDAASSSAPPADAEE